jgi:hypothetical protein
VVDALVHQTPHSVRNGLITLQHQSHQRASGIGGIPRVSGALSTDAFVRNATTRSVHAPAPPARAPLGDGRMRRTDVTSSARVVCDHTQRRAESSSTRATAASSKHRAHLAFLSVDPLLRRARSERSAWHTGCSRYSP